MGSQPRLWSIYRQAWGWPPATMARQQGYDDLKRHEEEIARHESFDYALFDEDETQLLGCIYVDPTDDEDADADGSWWTVDNLVGTDVASALTSSFPPGSHATGHSGGCASRSADSAH